MKLKNKPVKELKKEILAIISKHLDLNEYKLFFFGSRVNGKGRERSDIDIGIEGKEKVPSKALGEIREEIEEMPVLYSIDVVDFKDVSEDFYEVAKQSIENF